MTFTCAPLTVDGRCAAEVGVDRKSGHNQSDLNEVLDAVAHY